MRARANESSTPHGLHELWPSALAIGVIAVEVALTLGVTYVVFLVLTLILGRVPGFDLSLPLRLLGLIAIAAGVGVAADTLWYRHPKQMLLSTSVTLRKLFGRAPLENAKGRSEPFLVVGPYRYVRNPLYLGVVLIGFGIGLADSSVIGMLWGTALLGWFCFVLIPFEERELESLFGKTYARYRGRVPMLLPYRRRYET